MHNVADTKNIWHPLFKVTGALDKRRTDISEGVCTSIMGGLASIQQGSEIITPLPTLFFLPMTFVNQLPVRNGNLPFHPCNI